MKFKNKKEQSACGERSHTEVSHGVWELTWKEAQRNFSGAMETFFVLAGVVAMRVRTFIEVHHRVAFTCVHLSAQVGRHRCKRGVCGCHRCLEAERTVCLPEILHSGSPVFAGDWFQDPAPQGYQSLLMILVSWVGPQHLWMWDPWTPPANWTRFFCHHEQILCSVSLFAATPLTVMCSVFLKLARPPHRLCEHAIT